jgi:hypothetical protein
MDIFVNVVVGWILVPIIQVVKKYTGLKDRPMFWTALVISVIGGIVTGFATGQLSTSMFSSPEAFLAEAAKASGVVFASAQVLYQNIKKYLTS